MTRPHPTADRGTYIGLSRDAADLPIGERVGALRTPNPKAAGSTPAAGAISRGARLERPLAPGERLTADGDRISVRHAAREA